MKKANQKTRVMLRVIPFLLVITLSVSLTACKSKEAITSEVFLQKVEALGYQTTDITDAYAEYSHIKKVVNAKNENVSIDFVEISDTDSATGVFNNNKTTVEGYKGNGSSESSVSTSNYQKYTLNTSEKYYVVERVGTTVMYSSCDKSEKDALDNLINELGY